MVETLQKVGFNSKLIFHINKPFTLYYNNIKPIIRIQGFDRNGIYIYANPGDPNKCGARIYRKIMKMLPQYNYHIYTNPNAMVYVKCDKTNIDNIKSVKDIMKIYDKCFIALCTTRLARNGLNTVAESGYYGLKCIHNSDRPNAINFEYHSSLFGGTQNNKILNEVCNYLVEIINAEYTWVKENGIHLEYQKIYDEEYFGKGVQRILNLHNESDPPESDPEPDPNLVEK